MIKKSNIQTHSPLGKMIADSYNTLDCAIFVVEQYIVKPELIMRIVGKRNLIEYHSIYLNSKIQWSSYKKLPQTADIL